MLFAKCPFRLDGVAYRRTCRLLAVRRRLGSLLPPVEHDPNPEKEPKEREKGPLCSVSVAKGVAGDGVLPLPPTEP